MSYYLDNLKQAKQDLEIANANIVLQIEELEAEYDRNELQIDELQAIIGYVEAGSPPIAQADEPTNLQVTYEAAGSEVSVVISWDGAATADIYIKEYGFGFGFGFGFGSTGDDEYGNLVRSSVTSPQIILMPPMNTFLVTVIGVEAGKIPSGPTQADVAIGRILETPQDLVASHEGTGIRLDWSNVPYAAEYWIYRSDGGTPTFIGVAYTNTFLDTAGVVGTTYTYYVEANSQWDVTSQRASSAPIAPLPQLDEPENPTLVYSEGVVDGGWDAVPDADSYDYYVGTTSDYADAGLAGNVPTNSFTDNVPTFGITYYYWVVAKGAGFADSEPAFMGSIFAS